MQKWIFAPSFLLALASTSLAANKKTQSESFGTSFFLCLPFTSQESCTANAADDCYNTAVANCGGLGGLSSYSCESCGYYTAPTLADAERNLTDDTCPPPGQPSGWYVRLWHTCNN